MADTAGDYEALVLGMVNPEQEFTQQVAYDPDGDCIEFLLSDEDFFAERVDSLVTVYYGRETKQIIGCLIKGVKATIDRLSSKLPGFAVEVKDGRIKLGLLFTAGIWTADETPQIERLYKYHKEKFEAYQILRAAADRAQAEVELCAN